ETKINNKKLLSNINLTLEAGKILALVGHNGAGKTTLIKTIMAILDKSQGDIILNAQDTQENNLLTYKKQLNYLPEEPILLSEFTVMQHFQMYAISYDVDQAFFDQEVIRLTKLFN